MSSYFLSSKLHNVANNNEYRATVKRYISRIIQLYIFWFVININEIVNTWFIHKSGKIFEKLGIFVFQALTQSTFRGSWYLVGSIFASFFYYIVLKKTNQKLKLLMLISLFFFVSICSIKSLNNNLFFNLKSIIYMPMSIFTAPIYFAIGDLIYLQKSKKNGLLYLGLIFSILLWGIELKLTASILISKDQLLVYPLITYFLMSLLLNYKINLRYAKILRTTSTIMYFGQFPLIYWHSIYLKITTYSSWTILSILIIETLLLSFIIINLSRTKYFKWLRYSY